MRALKSWGLALFVVLSVTTIFVTPGTADDLEGVSQKTLVQLVVIERTRKADVQATANPTQAHLRSEDDSSTRLQFSRLLDLICVRLC